MFRVANTMTQVVQFYILFFAIACQVAAGFSPLVTLENSSIRPSTTALNGGGTGFASSTAGKEATVANVKELLDTSEMIFSMPCSSLKVSQMETLRQAIPESTSVKIVKNTLMRIAVKGTDYETVTESALLKGANMWFFIDDDISGTIDAVKGFVKDSGVQETHAILGGVIDSDIVDAAGVEAISKLPSKQELIAKIAGSIKAVPTKVARVIKAPGMKVARVVKAPNSKLVRAIKLAAEKQKE